MSSAESAAPEQARPTTAAQPLPPLSEEHRRMLEGRGPGQSAISRAVVEGRGYRTVDRRDELPEVFKGKQRRRGLLIPTYSPSGERGYRLRPKHRITRKRKYEQPSGVGSILDVHPFNLERVRDAAVDLWIVEGEKKADSLTSRGECAIALFGVFNFARDKSTTPLPCWEHVPLEGRTVRVVYDSDVLTNGQVQLALKRLVAFLEGRGARVLVVYLPASEDGEKQGADDYLAGGGTPAALRLMARPFDPEDLTLERVGRDDRLRAALEERFAYLSTMPLKTMRQNTAAAVARVLTEEAPHSGELVEEKGGRVIGVRVEMDRRTLALRSSRSLRSTHKAIEYLEDEERTLRRDNAGRPSHKRGAFVLLTTGHGQGGSELGKQYGGGDRPEGSDSQERETRRERFSPLEQRTLPVGVYPTRSPGEDYAPVPALRWPKVILYRARQDGRDVVAASHYVWRLGEKRANILRHILAARDWTPMEELLERFAGERTRLRDFRRWTFAPLLGWRYKKNRVTRKVEKVRVGPPLVEMKYTAQGAYTRALPGCLEVLEIYREKGDEIADAERQAERYAEQSRKYHQYLERVRKGEDTKADKTPELLGRERTAEVLEERRKDEERRWIEEQRQKVGTTAAVFLADELEGISAVRWRELRERWTERGRTPEDLRLAVTFGPFRFEREPLDDNALYVYPGSSGEKRQEPATVAPLYRKPEPGTKSPPHSLGSAPVQPARPYKRADGVYVHPENCACEWCAEESAPAYTLARGSS